MIFYCDSCEKASLPKEKWGEQLLRGIIPSTIITYLPIQGQVPEVRQLPCL